MNFNIYLVELLMIILVHIVNTQDACSTITPRTDLDCLASSNSKSICCYLTNDAGSRSCISKLKSELFTIKTTYKQNNMYYYLDCGIGWSKKTQNVGYTLPPTVNFDNFNKLILPNQQCGAINPQTSNQCTDSSKLGNSCCFFSQGGNTGCYYIGINYSGNSTYASMSMQCLGKYLTLSSNFVIFIFAIFLFF